VCDTFSAIRERRLLVGQRSHDCHDLENASYHGWRALSLVVAGRAAQPAPLLSASSFTCPESYLMPLRTGSCGLSGRVPCPREHPPIK
jgi:hypothetical protein